ncbi:MAG TPA: hypothetical protein VMN58_04280 [Acidimicrobiales bacterium]|nr:hypothetical protein [Acidimicrobiales bacterium]
MALIELTTFRLLDGVDDETFLEVDERARTAFLYHRHGLLRASTARGEGGWATLVLWYSEADADAAAAAAADHPAAAALAALVDDSSRRRQRFTTLD